MNLKNNRKRVRYLLINYPELRDDDRRLIAAVYRIEANNKYGTSTKEVCLEIFLADFGAGAFTSPEAIRRSRALLQERHPELRGRRYAERHGICVEKAKATLGPVPTNQTRIRAAMEPGDTPNLFK